MNDAILVELAEVFGVEAAELVREIERLRRGADQSSE